ncbi:hypothetical protein [Pseudomonas sp.]|uniref:hypothetical protein n=1 Tax=Pseudomonas sp. TaxID=306 RepID=UPI002583F776|nr:hypothetical protein [Pseudomonas sp.]
MVTTKDETWLDAGQLLCIDAGLSDEDRQDVLLCSLYFQLAASKKIDKLEHAARWFEVYQGCLQNLGWQTVRSGQFAKAFPPGLAFTWQDILRGVVREGLPFDLKGVAQVFEPGQGLDDPARSRMAAHSIGVQGKGTKARHQVALLLASGHSGARMNLLLVHFQTRQVLTGDITQARFDSTALQGEVTAAWLSVRPDPFIFPEFREDMFDRLKGRADHHLLRIQDGN